MLKGVGCGPFSLQQLSNYIHVHTFIHPPMKCKGIHGSMFVHVNISAHMWDIVCVCAHMAVWSLHVSHRGERGPLPFTEIRRFVFQRHIPQCRALPLLGPPPILITAQQILAFICRVEGQLKMRIAHTQNTHSLQFFPERYIIPVESYPMGASSYYWANHQSHKCD